MNVAATPSQATPRLHFAMLTYGALAATKRCVRSLAANTPAPFQLFVVDNASTDGTQPWLRAQRDSWFHHRCNATNRGVPGGRNDLLDFVLPQVATEDWIVFVDNDLEFAPGWLAPFLAAMRAHPEARVLGKVGHFVQTTATGRVLFPAPATTGQVDVVSGGFGCFVRADAAQAIGRFDENLGLFWHEDDDYCVRALQCGFDVVAVPESKIVHHEHASGVAAAGLPHGGSVQNQQYLARKWREAGWLDRDGWVQRRRGPWLPPAVRDELQRRGMRSTPLGRTELAAAMQLVEQLVDQPEPAAWLDRNRQPVPQCTDALLSLQAENAQQLGQPDLRAQLERIAADLRRARNATLLRPMVRTPGGPASAPTGHGVCRSADFDDAEFLAIADAMGLGAMMRDPHARDRVQWEDVAVALHLLRAGVRLGGAKVLLQGGRPAHLLAWLERAGAAVSLEADDADHGPFDAVLFHRLFDCDAIVQTIDARADEHTVVVLFGDVALNGVPSHDAVQPHQLELDLLARTGLLAAAPLHLGVDDQVLEACADRPGREVVRPHLSWLVGPQLRTSFVLGARLAPRATPAVLIPAGPRSTPTLRVGVDLRTLFQSDSTARGIGHYTIQHLQALCEQAPDVQFTGYVLRDGDRLPPALQRPNVAAAQIDRYRAADVDLVHVPDPMNLSICFDSPLRVLKHPRTTVTFHDLTPLHHYVEHWPRGNREAYADRLRQIEAGDCHLLTNSVFTAEDVLQHLRIDRARVTPILAGLHRSSRARPTAGAVAAVQRQLGIRGPFVLHVGALDPHKNFYTALNGFLLARARQPLQLVVVGAVDPGIARAAAFCAARKVPDVLFTGYLPRAHLDALYAAATGLLFLSRAEGFGFPILEAMAAGCPVVASNATSHPEVAGDAAVLLDPDDQAGAAAALQRLLHDAPFAQQLRQRGIAQAARFPWSAVADRTLAVWRKLAGAGALAPGSPLAEPALPRA